MIAVRATPEPAASLALPSDVRALLHEAAEWRLTGLLLERPRPGWIEQIEEIAASLDAPDLRAAAWAARAEASEGLFLAVLGPGGGARPREIAHLGFGPDPGHVLADISSFYGAFSFVPQTEETPDHASVEAGFLGFLKLKEAYARLRDDDEAALVASDAFEEFRTRHLAPLAAGLAKQLEDAPAPLALPARALLARTGPPPDAATWLPAYPPGALAAASPAGGSAFGCGLDESEPTDDPGLDPEAEEVAAEVLARVRLGTE